jgi:nucleoside-diphosphate-sugar epimerase
MIITGSSGFLGRRLLAVLKDRYRIYGIARRSAMRAHAPEHPNISWYSVDIGDLETLARVFDEIAADGPIDTVIHLAAHYDFTGEDHPDYWRTNVDGLRNVLDLCSQMGIGHFIFSSSVAACSFPRPGEALNESSPADGDHIYAKTKSIGERMLHKYVGKFPSTIIRFAALFSDWCEYPPLFMFLETWLARAWNSRILGGRGESAIPYLHVRDAVTFVERVVENARSFEPGEVLIASASGSVSHGELYERVMHELQKDVRPIYMPKPLVLPGIRLRCALGRLIGQMPFERPWMARYVDKRLTVDASKTYERLQWEPRPRLEMLRRMPFLLENMRAYPDEWLARNRAAMKHARLTPHLKVHGLLDRHKQRIEKEFTSALQEESARHVLPSYQTISNQEHEWNHRLILRHLMNAVRTRERGVFLSYCRDLAEKRHSQGFAVEELCRALETLNLVCMRILNDDPESEDVLGYVQNYVTANLQFGCDEFHEVYDALSIGHYNG